MKMINKCVSFVSLYLYKRDYGILEVVCYAIQGVCYAVQMQCVCYAVQFVCYAKTKFHAQGVQSYAAKRGSGRHGSYHRLLTAPPLPLLTDSQPTNFHFPPSEIAILSHSHFHSNVNIFPSSESEPLQHSSFAVS